MIVTGIVTPMQIVKTVCVPVNKVGTGMVTTAMVSLIMNIQI